MLFAVLLAAPSFDVDARGKSSGRTSASAKGKTSAKAKSVTKGRGGQHSRGKQGRGKRRAPPPAPMVQGEGADTPVHADAATPRNIPARAYAADGQSFYYHGERIHVRGAPVAGPGGSELAKQRLQKALDAGELTITDKAINERGEASATVRVNGRDINDLLMLEELRSGNPP